jgi:hypothetical protein
MDDMVNVRAEVRRHVSSSASLGGLVIVALLTGCSPIPYESTDTPPPDGRQ